MGKKKYITHKCMKSYSTSLASREMQTKTTMRSLYAHLNMLSHKTGV